MLVLFVLPTVVIGATPTIRELPETIEFLRVKVAAEEYRRKAAETALEALKKELAVERLKRADVEQKLAGLEKRLEQARNGFKVKPAKNAGQMKKPATTQMSRTKERSTQVVHSTRKTAPSRTSAHVRPATAKQELPVVQQAHAQQSMVVNASKARGAREQSTAVDSLRKHWPANVPFDLTKVEFKNVRKDPKSNGLASDVFVNGKPLRNKEGGNIIARGARAEEVALAVWQAKQG